MSSQPEVSISDHHGHLSLNIHHSQTGDMLISDNSMPLILTYMVDGEVSEAYVITLKKLNEVLHRRSLRIETSLQQAIQKGQETSPQTS